MAVIFLYINRIYRHTVVPFYYIVVIWSVGNISYFTLLYFNVMPTVLSLWGTTLSNYFSYSGIYLTSIKPYITPPWGQFPYLWGQGKWMAESIFEKVKISIWRLSICRKLVRLSIWRLSICRLSICRLSICRLSICRLSIIRPPFFSILISTLSFQSPACLLTG